MMKQSPSLLRRIYDGLAMFAVLNMLGVVGLLAVLSSSGAIDAEKLRRVVAVMRGEVPELDDSAGDASASTQEALNPADGGAVPRETETDIQVMRLEGERIKAELDQRLALNNSILLRVTTERERFQQERDAARTQQDQAIRKRQSDGFRKQLAIYEALAPKVAVEHLLSLADPAEAADYFLEMDTRKAKKIIEAAKRDDQKAALKAILRHVRNIEPSKAASLGDDGS